MGALYGKILLTGGTGTLGQAIVRRAEAENWDCSFTIYSRDPVKQQAMKRAHPKQRYALGDILDVDRLNAAAVGHDTIIHAAAMKHIPQAEVEPRYCYRVNVDGSINVLNAALVSSVHSIILISTDKACHPVNAYGCTKLMMERAAQGLAVSSAGVLVDIHLVRYGNVIGSTGSILPLWKAQAEAGQPLTLTDPDMTRFWITEDQAVNLIVQSAYMPNGTILIPKAPACSIGDMLDYFFPDADTQVIGLRPGEKRHEELLSEEESAFAEDLDSVYRLWPVTGERWSVTGFPGYTSDRAPKIRPAMLEEAAMRASLQVSE